MILISHFLDHPGVHSGYNSNWGGYTKCPNFFYQIGTDTKRKYFILVHYVLIGKASFFLKFTQYSTFHKQIVVIYYHQCFLFFFSSFDTIKWFNRSLEKKLEFSKHHFFFTGEKLL